MLKLSRVETRTVWKEGGVQYREVVNPLYVVPGYVQAVQEADEPGSDGSRLTWVYLADGRLGCVSVLESAEDVIALVEAGR